MSKTVVVIVNPGAAGAARAFSAESSGPSSPLAATLAEFGAEPRPMFGALAAPRAAFTAQSDGTVQSPGTADPPLESFFEVDAATEEEAHRLAERLAALPDVDGAYVQPDPAPAATSHALAEAPLAGGEGLGLIEVNTAQPTAEPAPPATPNYIPRQLYRAAVPGGIDVAYAWSKPGGRGAGIRVIDCEGAWRFTHEDLLQNHGGVIGPQTSELNWRNHGTAVVSVIGGDDNGFGVLGIAPDSMVRGSSIFGTGGLAAALTAAANALQAGDIILIEVQYGHPARGFTSVEWWPAEHAAIRYAVGKGIIVVEAAGNGGNNLDDPIYDTPLTGFPTSWRNPFKRGAQDSGAILVGAGAPPPGTHGRDHGPDRSRLDFSNFGSPIDVQGWGREVTSAGYGDLQGGPNEDLWYSDLFSGTSSASPIVVGALACVQGALKAAGKPLLTPATARTILRDTGSPQQDAPGRPATQRIGNRPNLRQILDRLLTPAVATAALHRYWNAAATDHFYTTNWGELGGGAHGWKYEGIQCYIFPSQVAGSVPLHRYWNKAIADHFYTTNWAELGAGAHGWAYEGIQGYVLPSAKPGAVPLHRYWGNTDHFYTTNWTELGSGAHGWKYEGIQCYVYPTATVPDAPSVDAANAETGQAAPSSEGMIGASFAEKGAAMAGSEAASSVPFAVKAAATAALSAGSGEASGPSTDWTSAAAARQGMTININLHTGSD